MKHKAIFYGYVKRKLYKFDENEYGLSFYRHREPSFYEGSEFIEDKIFLTLEIDNPPLDKNEEVYIEEINKTVKVKRRVRNAKGGYIYYTDYTVEVIEDEETEKSRIEALELQKQYVEKELEDNKQEMIMLLDVVTASKKWWQFWK